MVSIHAPRVGCDSALGYQEIEERVSIHAPRVGCDTTIQIHCGVVYLFQFTHPVWGATVVNLMLLARKMFQFTHPVWGATHYQLAHQPAPAVSIHAPRVGCDCDAQRYA